MQRVKLPGAVIGVLGSGQLGRMFAMEARRMGCRVHTFSPDLDTPTGQIADVEIQAPYTDLEAVRAFARGVDVITFEFENVPAETAEAAAEHAPVRPRGEVLHITQNRLREKRFLASKGFPVTAFREVSSIEALHAALGELGCPAILKTAGWGYDGKGQARIDSAAGAGAAWESIGGCAAILEAAVDFAHEASVVAARGMDGQFEHHGLFENIHERHILDVTIAPGRFDAALAREAASIAEGILDALDVVGVLCVEFFVTRAGKLVVNELAPRPHNSGHVTFDSAVASQFEQQLRAICGVPLGAPRLLSPAVMVNLLGDLWEGGEPDWRAACAYPDVKLHLYGKTAARPGRKMGHLTALAPDVDAALRMALGARQALLGGAREAVTKPV